MKVKQLMQSLQECDPEMEIILAKDSEGNEFSPLYCSSDEHYFASLNEIQVFDEDEERDKPNVLCLWPAN